MCKKFICLTSFVLVLGLSGVVQADVIAVYTDDFNTPHQYYDPVTGNPNVAGTIWDDFVGWDMGESVDVLVADMEVNHPDQLYIESSDGTWDDPWNPLAPFLYKMVPHDFNATVRISDYAGEPDAWVTHNDGGLMARVPFPSDPNYGGTGEDWVSIDYFPIWTCGNMLWTANNNVRTEQGHNGLEFDAHKYLRLRREGNTFIFETSPNPDVNGWEEHAASPQVRPDFDGLPVQVGLRQAIYNSGNTGFVAFDDFRLELYENVKARFPSPEDGATATPEELEWVAGDYAATHDVYIGTDLEDVNDANVPTATVADNNYAVSGLIAGITYYWRVDEVNGTDVWKGDVWSFTTVPFEAWSPGPADGAECTTPHGVISWNAGAEVDSHRIYFGTDEDKVTNATPFSHPGLLLYVASYDGTSYDLENDLGMLEFETTYYWRIDEVNFPTTWPGDTWSFTTAHYIDIQDVNRVGWWKLDGTECANAAFDSSGYHYHGVLVNGPSYLGDGNGPEETGGALEFDGKNDYVELPIGPLISSLKNSTFMMWMNSKPGGSWVRALDFGAEDPNFYMCLGPRWYFMDEMYFAITTDGTLEGPGAEIVTTTGFDLPAEWHHVAVTIDADANIAVLYYDGYEIASNNSFALSPNDLGETVNNWLGRSHDANDSYYWGSMAHFKIFDYTLTDDEVRAAMRVNPGLAWDPSPRDGQSIWAYWLEKWYGNKLYWTPGPYAISQEFYFGTDANNLISQGVIASDANSVAIPGSYLPLESGEDYFWQINTDSGGGVEAGPVWSFTTASVVFYDDFNNPWDYVSDGPNDWEGVLFGESLTDLMIEEDRTGADPCYPDELLIQSGGGWWADNPGNAYGPYLYKEVAGDFLATFYVADYSGIYDVNGEPDPNHEDAVFSNSIGLMARVGDINEAGAGEDWVSLDYFPIWGVGIIARDCNDGARTEDTGGDGTEWDADRYLQLERIGDNFRMYTSPDGIHWHEYPDDAFSPLPRPDMNGLPVQIGISQATFAQAVGLGAIDDFILIRQPWPNARGPRPAIGEVEAPINTKLRWTAGDFVQDVNGHYVYFGRDFNEVSEANATSHPNVDLYIVSAPYCDLGLLTFSTQYYWRVDEVNGGDVWTGDVWRFTAADYIVVDNFELYSTRDELRTAWKDGYALFENGSNITLSSVIDYRYPFGHTRPGPVHEGSDALQLVYDNDGNIWIYVPGFEAFPYSVINYYSEMEVNIVDLDGISNWELEGVKMLSLYFFGDPCNTIDANEQMYLAVEDIDGDFALVKYGDSIGEDVNNLLSDEWAQWAISLQEFKDVNANLDLTDIEKVYIGFGDRASSAPGGSGVVYFDSIRLYRPRCVPSVVLVDLTGDCTMDIDDFILLSNSWHGVPPTAVPIIDLDANDLSAGPVTTWANKVTPLGGQFDVNATDVNDNPVRETVAGRAAVTFDGNDYLIADFNAPGGITGANDFTVIMLVHNPSILSEEHIFAWARRDAINSTNAAVGYGSSAGSGAIVHWGEDDMGFDGGVPRAGEWHQIAVVYDGSTERVLVDGKLNAIERGKTLGIQADDPVVVGADYYWSTTDVNDPNYPNRYPVPTIHFSGSVARVHVYDEALGQHELEYMATGKFSADLSDDGKIDFKDLAMVVDEWLYEKVFPFP